LIPKQLKLILKKRWKTLCQRVKYKVFKTLAVQVFWGKKLPNFSTFKEQKRDLKKKVQTTSQESLGKSKVE
jgi:hypothetical protein